jgi:hypothetical protein
MLIQEKLGFSSALTTYESLGKVPGDTASALEAPLVYFGKLEKLLKESLAYIHPHLLLRNIANRDITVKTRVYGTDAGGEYAEFSKLMTLEPQSVIHVDLIEQREVLESTLTDGVAGLQLTHDGFPTDVVAEIINIDKTGGTVLYDGFRNLLLHQEYK